MLSVQFQSSRNLRIARHFDCVILPNGSLERVGGVDKFVSSSTYWSDSDFRLPFSLTSCRLQHFVIASENAYIRCKMPKSVMEQLRQIKEASLVISPDELVSQVFNSAHFN